ncbi:MAG: energy-coupling factor transporter transmembrane component T [Acidimicrobiales bacterium]
MSRPAALALWVLAGASMALASNQPMVRALVLVAAWSLLARRLVPGRHLRPLGIGLAVAGVLTVAFNTLGSHSGATVLASAPRWLPLVGGPLTLEALAYGAGIALGLTAAVSAAAALSLVIEPSDLVDALPWWLAHTGVAVGAALNLVPGVAASYVSVRDAQRLRGWASPHPAHPSRGRRPVRGRRVPGVRATRGVRGIVDLVVPVLLGAIESSVRLGEAMEARAFGSGARHAYLDPQRTSTNLVVGVGSVLALSGFATLRISGLIGAWYPYPTLALPALGATVIGPPAMLCLLGALIQPGPA